MQAITIEDGGELRFGDAPDPVPGAGEVVVELKAAAVNRRDLLVRYPPAPRYAFPLPLVPGGDGAGIRRDTGEEVVIYPCLHWGDEEVPDPGWEVLGGPSDGTYAELVKVPASSLFPRPPTLSWEEVAALPIAGLTAYRALFVVGELKAGEMVLVLGAGSGVSTFLVHLARQAGARVLVTSSTEEKIARAVDLGAEAGVLYTEEGWNAELPPVDLVLDSVGSTWAEAVETLRPGGRLVSFGATGGPTVPVDVRRIYLNSLSIRGMVAGSPRDFGSLLKIVERMEWRPVIDSVFPLAAAAEAHDRMKSGAQFGKVALTI